MRRSRLRRVEFRIQEKGARRLVRIFFLIYLPPLCGTRARRPALRCSWVHRRLLLLQHGSSASDRSVVQHSAQRRLSNPVAGCNCAWPSCLAASGTNSGCINPTGAGTCDRSHASRRRPAAKREYLPVSTRRLACGSDLSGRASPAQPVSHGCLCARPLWPGHAWLSSASAWPERSGFSSLVRCRAESWFELSHVFDWRAWRGLLLLAAVGADV